MSILNQNLKKMMKFFLNRSLHVFLAVIFITVGCDEEAKMGACRISKSVLTDTDGGVDEYTYTYNSDDKLIKWASVLTEADHDVYRYTVEFIYDSNGNLVTQIYDTDGRAEYTYNNDSQIIKEETFSQDVLTAIVENEYNASGQVIKRQHYHVTNGVATADSYNLIEYPTTETTNVSRSRKYSQDGTLISTTEYLYDDKKNPWTNVGLDAVYGYGKENNTTKVTRTEGASIQTSTYIYEYNEKDFPSEMTYIDNAGINRYTDVYTYACK